MSIIVGLVLTSTVYEMWGWMFPAAYNIDKKSSILFKQNSTPMQFLQCFSAVGNLHDWLSVKTSNDEMSCLHGIKALTSLSIPCLHTGIVIFVLSRPIDQEKFVQVSFFYLNNYIKLIVDLTNFFI